MPPERTGVPAALEDLAGEVLMTNRVQLAEAAALSTAISLKRIADALQGFHESGVIVTTGADRSLEYMIRDGIAGGFQTR